MGRTYKQRDISALDIISGKWVFSIVFTFVLFPVHLSLSDHFLSQDMYGISFLNFNFIITKTAGQARAVQVCYIMISLIAVFMAGFLLYRSVFERALGGSKPKETKEIISRIPDFPYDNRKLQMIIGLMHNRFDLERAREPRYLITPEKAMYQNFIITGTIGTGKTVSVMYPFLKQAIFYEADNQNRKAGMLILDVKGNFYEQALKYANECGRKGDIVLIQLDGEYTYNPLHKPNMEAVDLANRSRQVMDLFSGGSKKDQFWDTKAEHMMVAAIRLLRMTSNNYVTLGDIHEVVTNPVFLKERLYELDVNSHMLPKFEFNACINYFLGEFDSKAENMIESIKGCVTEMTGFFATSEKIHNAFCPDQEDLNFSGFEECINEGKIVVLAMNLAKHPVVSKTIAAYLKLDFQSEVRQRTTETNLNKERPMFFFCDEYQEFVTKNDGGYYGLARESKCCSIVSSQSYTSILQTLQNREAFETLLQNLINKICLRTDDKLTIETLQFLTGKEEKEKFSKNLSESINDAKRSRLFGRLSADKASFSESINVTTQRDYVFEEKIFTQVLELFKAVCFTAHETGMYEPHIVHLLPYYEPPISLITCDGKNFIRKKPETYKDLPEKVLIKLS